MFSIIHDTRCPRCGNSTHRTRTPFMLKMVRAVFRDTVTRRCNTRTCRWRGLAYRVPGYVEARPRQHHTPA